MTLLERNKGILERIERMGKTLAEPIRRLLIAGKREQLAQGVDARGNPYARLRPSTLRYRTSGAPPLGGGNSKLANSYDVEVEQLTEHSIRINAGFRVPWAQYHVDGTRKMVSRDPSGFRQVDLDETLEMIRKEMMGNG